MSQRIQYFDCLRGLAISMVVGVHTFTISDNLLLITIRQVLNSAVPLFLAISGYFLSRKTVSDNESYLKFIKKQVPSVYIPCLIWSFPLFVLELMNGSSMVHSLFLLLFCGYSIYYFVALIIQYYLLLPILQKANTNRLWGGVTCFISMSCISLVTYLIHFKGIDLPLIAFAGPFPVWIMFFCEGMIIGTKGRNYSISLISVLSIFTLALAILETKYIYSLDGGGLGVKLSSFLFSFFMTLLLFSEKVERFISKLGMVYRAFVRLGGFSFGIYLIHCYLIRLFSYIGLLDYLGSWPLKWVTLLLLSSLIVAFGKRYMPWTIKFLGFR